MAALPYITTPGNIGKALLGIKTAATPPSVSQDFVKTILKILGGPGNEVTSYLRKIGFTSDDGTPSNIYKKFRNTATEGSAAAAALRFGYKPLFVRNEYMYELSEDKLKGLVIEETGWSKDARTLSLTLLCIKQLKAFAKWDEPTETAPTTATASNDSSLRTPVMISPSAQSPQDPSRSQQIRMQLGYTINLNLPATSDVAVFNAIFKSLKENLLKGSDE
jgi:hypothetical protein